jgi:hypothetical protein
MEGLSRKGAMRGANIGCKCQGWGWGCPSQLEHTTSYHISQMLNMKLREIMFVLLDFVLIWSNLLILFSYSSLLEWECLVYAILSWV